MPLPLPCSVELLVDGGFKYECRITGPRFCDSIIILWGKPNPRREAESYAVIATVVRACICDSGWEGDVAGWDWGLEEMSGVSARSERWKAILLSGIWRSIIFAN